MKLTKASPYEIDKLKEAVKVFLGGILFAVVLLVVAKVASSLLGNNNVVTLLAGGGVYIMIGLVIPFGAIYLVYQTLRVLFRKG